MPLATANFMNSRRERVIDYSPPMFRGAPVSLCRFQSL
jgi:hypothetical protein